MPVINPPRPTDLPVNNPPKTTNPGSYASPPLDQTLLNQMSGEDRDAYVALRTLFESYGLGTLAPKILEYVQQGYGSDTITILLQETAEYKRRFAANDGRRRAGLPVLSPSEYLATEEAYRQVMRNSGLPAGFYDNVDDFTQFLTKDVSPTELKDRVDIAVLATENAAPFLKEALFRGGVDSGAMAAYFLDPNRATSIIKKQMGTAQIGAAALRNRLEYNQTRAMDWYMQGVTAEQAAQGYGAIAGFLGDVTKLGQLYGEEYGQQTAEAEVFGSSGVAQNQRKRLASRERAQFSGASGTARAGLSIKRQT